MIPIPIWALPTAILVMLTFGGGTAFFGFEHGVSVQEARQTKAELAQERVERKQDADNIQKAHDAGANFEANRPIIIQNAKDRTAGIVIPPDADPYVPVWFVRMFDRLASTDSGADTYPGEPAGAPSRTRLSGTKPVLESWVAKYETCRKQIDGIRELSPVMPAPAVPKKGIMESLNPF